MEVISLLLVVTVLRFIYINDWFYVYKSDFEQKVEAKNFQQEIQIQKVDGTYIFLNNNFANNLEISSILIGDKECLNSPKTINKGIAQIDIGGCTENLGTLLYNVKIISDSGILVESEVIRNPVQGSFILTYVNGFCDFSSGYIKILGLSGFDNAHVEPANYNNYTYNLCARHLNYDPLGTSNSGNFQRLLSLTDVTNSAVWINKTLINQTPAQWYDISISSSNGGVFSYNVTSTDLSYSGYKCVGKIDRDDNFGSHMGDCSSSLPDTIWVKLE